MTDGPTEHVSHPVGVAATTEDLCEVVITAPDTDWLIQFVRTLIGERLAAGCHVIERVQSLYPWQGQVRQTSEARAAIRTRLSHLPEIIRLVEEQHPYQLPSVVALPLAGASEGYATWIRASTEP